MFAHFQKYHRNHEKKNSLFVGSCHKLQTFVWMFNHVSRVNLIPVQPLEPQTRSNNQSQHDLLYGGVNLLIV